MVYEYECRKGHRMDIVKSFVEIDRVETCERCGTIMERQFRPKIHTSFGTFKEGHYSAFGKTFTQAHQLKNEIRRLNGEEGRDIVEVGNEKKFPKRPKVNYHDDRAIHELKKVLGK